MVTNVMDVRLHGNHSKSRKGAVGIDRPGRPGEFLELRPSSHASATSSHSTIHSSHDRQPVASSNHGTWTTNSKYSVKEAFLTSSKVRKETSFSGGNVLLAKNIPVHVSLSGEWALQECEEYTAWTNRHLKKGKHRVIGDIRKSIGDGQTLLHLLESLAGEKVTEAYSRPITRAQKLDNLQRCMIFMADKGIDLDSINLNDLVEGNLKGVLALCSRLQQRFEPDAMLPRRTPSPDGLVRPSSSSSADHEEKLSKGSGKQIVVNGFYNTQNMNGPGTNPVQDQNDGSVWTPPPIAPLYSRRTHQPTSSSVERGLPGQLDRDYVNEPATAENNPLVSTTELDKRAVSQSGADVRRQQGHLHVPQGLQRKPSVEERLRTLLNSPNLGGHAHNDEDSEEELVIPPPPVIRTKSIPVPEHQPNVEERLRVLLDETEKDFYEPASEFDLSHISEKEAGRQVEGIAYVPSHPSEKLRNVAPTKRIDKRDSFTGTMNTTANSINFNMKTRRDGIQFPSTSTPSVPRAVPPSQSHPKDNRHYTENKYLPLTKAKVTSSEVVISQPVIQNGTRRDLYNEQISPGASSGSDPNEGTVIQQRPRSQTELLNEVANKLVSEVTPHEQRGKSPSHSSPDTPLLPMLSPASSLATFTMEGSDSNNSSPRESYHTRSRSSSVGSEYRRVSGSSGRGGSSSKDEGLESIQGQLEALESMYSDILSVLELDLKDPPVKPMSSQKTRSTQDLRARANAYKKQRSKDIRAVNQRFDRLESHLVTLARSVAHLSSELRSQAALSQEMEEIQRELHDLKEKRSTSLLLQSHNNNNTINTHSLELSLLHRVDKLKRFFGEDPPLVALFLKKLGYERLSLKFEAEQISIAELPYMTEERLQNIGIPLGPRLRILDEIRKLTT